MSVITIPRVLRERLGEDGVDALLAVFSEVSLNTRNDLATKTDIKDMATKDDIKDMATKDDIKALRQATKDDLDKLRFELKSEIDKSKVDSIRWMLAFWASQIGILIASIAVMFKFFLK
ncbi:MAG: hypothetical protein HQK99_14085 [Nitrospirae bacterium]|nr:hypothetical protein [Nitrospirota bacterium]